jgi:hypothetical protein
VLDAADHRGGDDETHQHPHQQTQRVLLLHPVDDLADHQRLGEGRDGGEHAQHSDDDENALLLEDEGEQLSQTRARTVIGRAAAGAGRAGGAGRGHEALSCGVRVLLSSLDDDEHRRTVSEALGRVDRCLLLSSPRISS